MCKTPTPHPCARPAARPLPDHEYAELLVANIGIVWRCVRRGLTDELQHLAEDTVQSALLSLWRNRTTYDPDRITRTGRPAFRTWLFLKARSYVQLVTDKYERRRRMLDARGRRMTALDDVRGAADPKAVDPAEQVPTAERWAAVDRAVDRLPPPQREVIEARLSGRERADIAARDRVTKQAISYRFKQATATLRDALCPLFGDD